MSWLRSAVNKAVEAGNKNNLTRTVRNYADSVVQHAGQAVAEGAKRFQDRLGSRSFRSVKKSIQRLEEAAVSCRGAERGEILRRWVILLKEVERLKLSQLGDKENTPEQISGASEDVNDVRKKISTVLYYDSDVGGEPMNFRDVFLQSQALEGITLSLILEAPNDEEVSLLSEMFRLCLTGGKEVHNAIVSSIQDLAKAFSSYNDEVLVKREELLQFAQGAITGLKINADLGRIDEEASSLKKKLDGRTPPLKSPSTEGHDKASEETKLETVEALKEALAQIRACSRLEGLLLKKKLLNNGDSSEIHAQKVDKLKVLSESLASSSAKAENRISDNRFQKEEALKVRVSKAGEVGEREKEIEAEVAELERQRDDLEAQLKKVNISLAAANARLRNTREERDQFEEANTKIVAHLETKEDELSKSIASCRIEADVLQTWINFLEDTWVLRCSYAEIKEKQVNDELEKHEDYFVNFAIDLLSAYKKELGPSISRLGKFVENLKNLSKKSGMASSAENVDSKVLNPLRSLEEEYLDHETKIITTFSVVENMKEQFYSERAKTFRKDDPRVKELFDDIEKLRAQFEAVERPILQIDTPIPQAETPSDDKLQSASSDDKQQSASSDDKLQSASSDDKLQSAPSHLSAEGAVAQKAETVQHLESGAVKVEKVLNPEDELAKLESEFGKVSHDYSTDEVGEWEFDELERELRSGDSSTTK